MMVNDDLVYGFIQDTDIPLWVKSGISICCQCLLA